MAKYFYGGILLPEIPQDILPDYKYIFIRDNVESGYYDLIYNTKPWYYNGDAVFCDANTESQWYRISKSSASTETSWTFNKVSTGGFTISSEKPLLWTSHNVTNGVGSTDDIYFYSSKPSSTTAWKCAQSSSAKSLTCKLNVIAGMWVLATVTTRSTTTYPSDWQLLHETESLNSDNSSQRMAFLCKMADVDGDVEFTVTQSSSNRIYINLIGMREIYGFKYHSDGILISNEEAGSITVQRPPLDTIIWACSGVSWSTGDWSCNELNINPISFYVHKDYRQVNFIDTYSGETRTFSAPNETAYIVGYIEVRTTPLYYMIRSGNVLYSIIDNNLVQIDKDLSSDTFIEHGINEIPDGSLLLGLENPDVLCWSPKDNHMPTCTAKIKAVPMAQEVISDDIDLTHPTIIGINSVVCECEGSPLFAFNFNGAWKEYNGTSWVNANSGMTLDVMSAITSAQWDEMISGLDSFKIKFILNSADDKVINVTVNFNVDVTKAI